MLENKPLVSVFVPYYNDRKYIEDVITSVLEQTYENWELFLFDRASTDGSKEIAVSFKDPRIKHVGTDKNLGAGSGYNLEITLPKMSGKYVKLLCADDILKPTALEDLVECFEKNPDKDIVFADMDFVSEDLESLDTTWRANIPKSDFSSNERETLLKIFKGHSHLAYPAAMIKMEALKDIKLDRTFIMLFDVSLWLKLLIKNKKITFLDKSTVDYRISSNQLSSIANLAKAARMGYFELFQLLNIYYEIKDVELIKYLCPCEYAEMLKSGDEEFIPFVLSYFFASVVKDKRVKYFKDQQSVREVFGNTRLYEILQDYDMQRKIEEKFGFGIKEFRAVYSTMPPKNATKQSLRMHIYSKRPKDLSVLQLLFLLLRQALNFINIPRKIKKMFKKKNKNKRYTV